MKTITIQVYSFEELSAEAQQKAIERYSELNLGHGWWQLCYEQVVEIAAAIGIEIEPNNIWFSGFYGQGDGASFSGKYSYKEDAIASLQEIGCSDLHYRDIYHIVNQLIVEQSAWKEQLSKLDLDDREYMNVEEDVTAIIESRESTLIDVKVEGDELIGFNESGVVKCMKDFCKWIYRLLESEYEHRASEEQIKDTIIANEYLFFPSGKMYVQEH